MKKEELTKALDQLNIKYCFNNMDYDKDKLRFIIVGDNPGKAEYQENKYFVGQSGKQLRKQFLEHGLCSDFDVECMTYNKTFIHTTSTNALNETVSVNHKDLLEETQSYTAKEIAKTANKFNLPILVFGKGHLKPNKLFDTFWRSINIHTENKSNILVFNHPAYSNFNRELNKYKKQLTFETNLELLFQIGRINTDIIQKAFN